MSSYLYLFSLILRYIRGLVKNDDIIFMKIVLKNQLNLIV
jgi:hypothetical protein